MHPLARNISQGAIDHSLSLEPARACKGIALDQNREVRFPAAIIASMAMMLGAIIDDLKLAGREGGYQQLLDFFCDCS